MPFQHIALEAQMTHQSNQRDVPVQKAGQAVGTAPPASHEHRPKNPVGGTVRVAGGGAMSTKKTSTAALDSFRHGSLRIQRRVPRHPAGS